MTMLKSTVAPLEQRPVCEAGATVSAAGVGGVTTGGLVLPELLVSCAVDVRPVASVIVKVTGEFGHTPLVTTSKNPPDVVTVVFTMPKTSGRDDVTR